MIRDGDKRHSPLSGSTLAGQAGGKLEWAKGPVRKLTRGELFVLGEVQAYWGDQNSIDDVFFTDRGDAALFVRARDGTKPVMVVLTNLAAWHDDGTLSLDALRGQIKGPNGS
jgi:hypothetical protein